MDRTAKNFLADAMLAQSAYWVCAGTAIAALMGYFNVSLGITNLVVGLTSTLPMLQLVGGWLYSRSSNQNRTVRVLCLLWRLLLPLVFFSVLLGQGPGLVVAIGAFTAVQVFYQFSCPAQNDWMVNLLKGKISGEYYSVRETFFMLLLTLSGAVVNLALEFGQRGKDMRPAFVVCGVWITVLVLASLFPLFRLAPPVSTPAAESKVQWHDVWADKVFQSVLRMNTVWNFFATFIGGFASTYQVRVLDLSFLQIMIWSACANLLRALLTTPMARLAKRISWRNTVILGFLLQFLCAVLWACTTPKNSLFLFPVASLIGGSAYSALSVGIFHLQLDAMPLHDQSLYFSANSTCSGIAALLGTFCCSGAITFLSARGIPLFWLFLVGAVGALLAVGLARILRSRPESLAADS
jgi:hypothetical protein